MSVCSREGMSAMRRERPFGCARRAAGRSCRWRKQAILGAGIGMRMPVWRYRTRLCIEHWRGGPLGVTSGVESTRRLLQTGKSVGGGAAIHFFFFFCSRPGRSEMPDGVLAPTSHATAMRYRSRADISEGMDRRAGSAEAVYVPHDVGLKPNKLATRMSSRARLARVRTIPMGCR